MLRTLIIQMSKATFDFELRLRSSMAVSLPSITGMRMRKVSKWVVAGMV